MLESHILFKPQIGLRMDLPKIHLGGYWPLLLSDTCALRKQMNTFANINVFWFQPILSDGDRSNLEFFFLNISNIMAFIALSQSYVT